MLKYLPGTEYLVANGKTGKRENLGMIGNIHKGLVYSVLIPMHLF